MKTPYFYYSKDNRGEWRWRFSASNGETIAVSSEGYKNLVDCEAAVQLVKKDAPGAVSIGDDEWKKLRGK